MMKRRVYSSAPLLPLASCIVAHSVVRVVVAQLLASTSLFGWSRRARSVMLGSALSVVSNLPITSLNNWKCIADT